MHPTKILYTAKVTVTGGRIGEAVSEDGKLTLKMDKPVEMGGQGAGTNPEQLFAAGYAACYLSALTMVAGKRKVDAEGASVTAEVGIGPAGQGFALAATLHVNVPKASPEDAKKIADEAHQVCPYSNATRGNIQVTIDVSPK
ncbi:MAG: Organic hydroperoxide resistance protein OhrB [Desulfovibrio sp.]